MSSNAHELCDDINNRDILELIKPIRQKLASDRHVFIQGHKIENILHELGASEDDLTYLKKTHNGLVSDPTLAFRRSKNGRFMFDLTDKTIIRLEFQPFILTAKEDFVRHDSGVVRNFRGIQDDLQKNTAFIALMRFKALVINGMTTKKRPNLDYESPNWVSTVFHLRTVTNTKILGQPAAEGVHSDGVDHTMTTFLGAKNMRSDSAISKIHDMTQITGTPWDSIDERLVINSFRHHNFLDTLLIVDSELKHTVSPVFSADVSKDSYRDMLVIFTRKFALSKHVSFPYDSKSPHPDMPLKVPLIPTSGV